MGRVRGAQAQGKLDARYTVSLAGIPLGKGAWVIDIADDQYTAAASGMTTGLVRVFTSGQGTGAVARRHRRRAISCRRAIRPTITTDKKTEEIRDDAQRRRREGILDHAAESPLPPNAVPVTDAHRRNVIDPMTGSLVRVPGNGDLLGAGSLPAPHGRSSTAACATTCDFAYKRMDQVKADKGYEGPALVCAVYFSPVAGYVPDRAAIKYLIEQRDMEVWLAPVAGTRVLVPFRFSVPTPLGLGRAAGDAVRRRRRCRQGEREDAVARRSRAYPRSSPHSACGRA